MTKQTLLVHTIGYRDLQFHKATVDDQLAEKYLVDNRDDPTAMVVSPRSASDGTSFRSMTKAIYERLVEAPEDQRMALLEGAFCPMLDSVAAYVQAQAPINELWIMASKQEPMYDTDNYFLSKIMELYIQHHRAHHANSPYASIQRVLTQALRSELKYDRKGVLLEIHSLFQTVDEQFGQVYISNKGGLPKVTEALHLIGVLTDYHYLSSHKKEEGRGQMVKEEDMSSQYNIVIGRIQQYLKNGGRFL